MGFLNNLINTILRVDMRYQSSLTVRQFGGAPVYPDPKVDSFIRDGYAGNASIFSIINLAARKFSFIPRYLMKEENEDAVKKYKQLTRGEFVPRGALQKASMLKKKAYSFATGKGLDELLRKPNPIQGQDAFFFSVYAYYKIAGESFTWLNRGELPVNEQGKINDAAADKLPVLEMYNLPPNLVEVIPDPDDVWAVDHYVLNLSGKRVTIRKNDIIHWKSFNPEFDAYTGTHLRGLPPLRPGKKIVSQDEDSTDAAVAMYQNGGARGVLFERSLKNISPTQKAQIEEITAKRINNKDLKSSVANMQGDWGYLDIGKDSVDMQLLEGNDKAFSKICHVLGVPPGLFLIDQTYENQRSNRKRMLSELIIPDCASFNDEMNRMLLPAFGLRGYRIEPDYSELPEMQEDMKDMIEYLKDSPVTLNEFRDALGYDPLSIEGMDMVYIDSGKIPVDGAGIEMPANNDLPE